MGGAPIPSPLWKWSRPSDRQKKRQVSRIFFRCHASLMQIALKILLSREGFEAPSSCNDMRSVCLPLQWWISLPLPKCQCLPDSAVREEGPCGDHIPAHDIKGDPSQHAIDDQRTPDIWNIHEHTIYVVSWQLSKYSFLVEVWRTSLVPFQFDCQCCVRHLKAHQWSISCHKCIKHRIKL